MSTKPEPYAALNAIARETTARITKLNSMVVGGYINEDTMETIILRALRAAITAAVKESGAVEALECAVSLDTSQNCPPENHTIVVQAMDAISRLHALIDERKAP